MSFFAKAVRSVRESGHIENYLEEIPDNWKRATSASFFAGSLLSFAVKAHPISAFGSGALSAVATLTHAAVTPFFKRYFGEDHEISFREEMGRATISLLTAHGVGMLLGGPFRVLPIIVSISLHVFNLVYLQSTRPDIDSTESLLLFV
jgi:hypothetical protein